MNDQTRTDTNYSSVQHLHSKATEYLSGHSSGMFEIPALLQNSGADLTIANANTSGLGFVD